MNAKIHPSHQLWETLHNFRSIFSYQRHRSLVYISFKDQSDSPPWPSAAEHDEVLKEKILACTHCKFGLGLAKFAAELGFASMVVAAEEAVPFAVWRVGDEIVEERLVVEVSSGTVEAIG